MTHTHLDHVGCLPEILEAIPHGRIWVHKDEAEYLERGDDRIVFGNKMFESMIRSQYSIPKDFFKIKVDKKLEGGESLCLGGIDFKVIHLPGHSAGSIGLFNEEYRWFMSATRNTRRRNWSLTISLPLTLCIEAIPGDHEGLGVDILLPCHNRIVKKGAESMVRNTVRQWAPMLAEVGGTKWERRLRRK